LFIILRIEPDAIAFQISPQMKRGITRLSIIFLICCMPAVSHARHGEEPKRMTAQDYISHYKQDAVRDMLKTGVPASITLAQGMYESEYGNSRLAMEANNHFGIKCHREWTGPTFTQDDDTKNECFRKYSTVLESYDDHSNFLRSRERYRFLFDYEITDYRRWALGLKKAGYATNPEYAQRLIRIIEENGLNELDVQGLAANIDKPVPASAPASAQKTQIKAAAPAAHNTDVNTPASFVDNHIKYVVAQRGESYLSIAQQQDMMLWELLKYNDADKGTSLAAGEIVYLKPKKNKAKVDFHIVREGETMRSISQLYGIKMKQLYHRNHMELYTEPQAGIKLSMNKTAK
jgi:hypothetical protein